MPEYSVENLTRGLALASRVRLAESSVERRRGLLGISELPAGTGIWINPCEAVHTFCMQITLDALFLDSELRVKKISAHLKPWRIAICLAATSVLEIAAGAAAGALTQPGDKLSFHPLEPSHAETPHENGVGGR